MLKARGGQAAEGQGGLPWQSGTGFPWGATAVRCSSHPDTAAGLPGRSHESRGLRGVGHRHPAAWQGEAKPWTALAPTPALQPSGLVPVPCLPLGTRLEARGGGQGRVVCGVRPVTGEQPDWAGPGGDVPAQTVFLSEGPLRLCVLFMVWGVQRSHVILGSQND